LMISDQTFQSMLNVTGQAGAQTNTQVTEFNLRTSSLSDTDSLSMVNAPLMVAATSLAGEVCNGLVAKEKAMAAASRLFFNGVDFTKPVSQNNAQAYSDSASAMAQAFYGRALDPDEQAALSQYYVDFGKGLTGTLATNANQTSVLYITLCAAMLSSFDALTF